MSAQRRTRTLAGLVAAAAATALIAPAAVAEGDMPEGQPVMCSGRSDPSMTVTAHANGTPKYVLNLETDAVGHPTGVLVLGRFLDRVYVDDFCRFWQHLPGQEYGGHEGGELPPEDATTAHAVGFGSLPDGTRVLVRTDVRETDEGAVFRARYRPMGAHAGHEDGTATTHVDEEWTAVPAEGWAPLDHLDLR